jgi:cysteinyl-tRNA synthetase
MNIPLAFHNSASASVEPFSPIDPNHIRLYVCGPTVYDHIHIGNARPLVVFDILYRLLRHAFPHAKVTYVRNITDIDDKIIQRAKELNISTTELTQTTTEQFLKCCQELHTLSPDFQPKASEYIPQMISIISCLIKNGHAYDTLDGHVLCSTTKNKLYGSLSRRNHEEQIAGARVEVADHKRNPADFVLWKPSSSEQPGWDSPWGFGRPGWHTECVAMSSHLLGNHFDFHGGGIDLIFPHHENELHQCRCMFPESPFVNIWLHNGYVVVNNEKMSKSLGNVTHAKDMIQTHSGLTLKIALLMTHYRKPLNINNQRIQEASALAARYKKALALCSPFLHSHPLPPLHNQKIALALAQDLNTYTALSLLNEQAAQLINDSPSPNPDSCRQFLLSASLLGFPTQPQVSPESDHFIQELVDQRTLARQQKQFDRADELRKKIEQLHVSLSDHNDGSSSWERNP